MMVDGETVGSRAEGGSTSQYASAVLESFSLYETRTRFYVVGSARDPTGSGLHRVMKLDRSSVLPPKSPASTSPYPARDPITGRPEMVLDEHGALPNYLKIVTDDVVYTTAQLDQLLDMIDKGNKASGGLSKKHAKFFGILGFVRLHRTWYVVLINRRTAIATFAGHIIYHIEEVIATSLGPKNADKSSSEQAQLNTFTQVDLSKNFYYSHTYDMTNSLQYNFTNPASAGHPDPRNIDDWTVHSRFMWNYHLVRSAFDGPVPSPWVIPIVHGFADQASGSSVELSTRRHVQIIPRKQKSQSWDKAYISSCSHEGVVSSPARDI